MVVLKDFALFLKQESVSTVQGSRAQGSKTREMKKAFSKVSQATSKLKEFLKLFSNLENLVNLVNSILCCTYTTLQAKTSILTCPPSFPYFPVSRFAPLREGARVRHI